MGGSDHKLLFYFIIFIILIIFLNAVTTIDVLTASNNYVRLGESRTVLFVVSFWENKETRPRLLVFANFITFLTPEISRDSDFFTFFHINLKAKRWWEV